MHCHHACTISFFEIACSMNTSLLHQVDACVQHATYLAVHAAGRCRRKGFG
jgi:hypothetical protein